MVGLRFGCGFLAGFLVFLDGWFVGSFVRVSFFFSFVFLGFVWMGGAVFGLASWLLVDSGVEWGRGGGF